MKIEKLSDISGDAQISADLVIVGAGPVGLTIARECAKAGRKVLIVESGVERADPAHSALIQIENVGELTAEDQIVARKAYHEMVTQFWSQENQPFGVVCRGLGGSTQEWAGKSAPFDPIDFEPRPWVHLSDWPVSHAEITPYIRKAMAQLNLIPEWQPPQIHTDGVTSFYWQFARSRTQHTDVMRFGEDLLLDRPEHIHVLLDATVTHIALSPDGTRFDHLDVVSVSGKKARVSGRFCVLAANAIETPRLLLASRDVHPNGIGNAHDNVGRYLMDHPSSTVGTFAARDAGEPGRRFGFSAVTRNRRAHMFLHGLALTPEVQRKEGLLNAAIFFIPDLSPDDPWEAFKRLVRGRSSNWGRDLLNVGRDFGTLVKALGVKFVQHPRVPDAIKSFIVNAAIRLQPNLVATEFASKGLPKKLTGLRIKAIVEQVPDRESRVTLSDKTDRFGTPLARVDWKINDLERTTLLRISELAREAIVAAGMPAPRFAEWIDTRRIEDAVIIDMCHTAGTTRMSDDPRTGVVDRDCRIHGLDNLYVCGGSVFPTAGHTNPTLMFVSFALRLAEHLDARLEQVDDHEAQPELACA